MRWALEEVGQPYDVRLVPWKEMKDPEHRARHPFGKIPTYEDGDLTLFESGAIVLHVAETHAGLLPSSANGRAHAIMWMFAAVSTVEQPLLEFTNTLMFEREKSWYEKRIPILRDRMRERLTELSNRLGDAEWLDGEFHAGDLLMIAVLRRLASSGLLNEYPNVASYVARGEARPAFKRAFAAQLKVFEDSQKESAGK